jgi:putative sigma-54 modulation protein
MNVKVTYKGIQQDLPPKLQQKLDAKFSKLSKLLERRGEKEAHVIVTSERHLHRAEITLQFYDHQLVGIGSDSDLFNAVSAALTKLEKQAVKHRSKWREKARRTEPKIKTETAGKTREAASAEQSRRIYRVNHHERRKPITLEEAMLQMESGLNYLVYRDADKDRTSVLIRRSDGHYDLIEG